jgi:tetratricopeptide (TPR) repeat protein
MRNRTFAPLLGSLVLIATSLLTNAAYGDTVAAQERFESGNIAFENGDFSAALDDYNEALTLGKNTPRLFYNIGLSHYRLGQYSQAKSALLESSTDSEMAALSYFVLGAVADKEGDSDAATEWFKLSYDLASSDKLRRKAKNALNEYSIPETESLVELSAGLGYDSNAYRSPDAPYIDLSKTIPTLVVPVVQTGMYVPVRVRAAISKPVSNRSYLVASYRLRAINHADTELTNADESSHRVAIGMARDLGRERSRNRRMSIDLVIRRHDETNFDRDDGLDRFDQGSSIADRYSYLGTGAEVELKNRLGRYRYELTGGFEERDYEDVPTASSYDLSSYWLGGAFKIPLGDASRLKFAYEYYVRDFDQRRSKDLTGDASLLNPPIEYQYNIFEAGIRHRFNEKLVTEFIYYYTTRTDEFLGYNDYTKSKIRLDTTFEFSDRLDASIQVDYRDQDYPNAFAFDDPGQARKVYEELQLIVKAEYRLTDQFSLRADVKLESVESSDTRGEYDRALASIGVTWGF